MTALLKLVRNNSLLNSLVTMLSGNILASVLGVFSTSVTAKYLGVELFGYLVLALTVATVSHKVFDCQTWQAFIRFYSRLNKTNNRLKNYLIRFFVLIEVGSVILAISTVFIFQDLYISLFEIPLIYSSIFLCYSLIIFFKFTGVSVGVLRFYNKFYIISKIQVLTSAVKLTLVLYCALYLESSELYTYLFVWVFSDILLSISLGVSAFLVYKENNSDILMRPININGKYKRVVFKFCLFTNLASTIDLPIKEFDVLLIGAITNSSTAGVYKIAKQIMGLIANLASPLYQVIYPELAKRVLVSKANAIRFCNMIATYTLIGSTIISVLLITTLHFWVVLLFGEDFLNYKFLICIAIVFKSIDIVFTSYHALFIALGYVYDNFLILFFVNTLSLIVACISIPAYGAEGVFLAFIIQMLLVLIFKYRKIKGAK
ncbi:lipopolysaccharide biosynthesis protein [Pseudoalteromonas rhizosphaerae]|uniref:lipopolysaccharide biosynthesis protein n=1 Tax=Pseudoalteromonas rhizosphaerae TaxID=2518973 RepID=UPI00384B63D0